MSLEGQNAVVTGAASGIGRACAVRLAQDGADVAIFDVDERGLADTAALIDDTGQRCVPVTVDLLDRLVGTPRCGFEVAQEQARTPLVDPDDGARIPIGAGEAGELCFTTDSYVVQPLEFPGDFLGRQDVGASRKNRRFDDRMLAAIEQQLAAYEAGESGWRASDHKRLQEIAFE